MKRTLWIVFGSLAAVAIFWSAAADKPVLVRTAQVELRDPHSSVRTNGRVEAERPYEIRAPISGQCRSIAVREGVRLRAGETILALDHLALQPDLAAARAELAARSGWSARWSSARIVSPARSRTPSRTAIERHCPEIGARISYGRSASTLPLVRTLLWGSRNSTCAVRTSTGLSAAADQKMATAASDPNTIHRVRFITLSVPGQPDKLRN